jgi:hypothetical protein
MNWEILLLLIQFIAHPAHTQEMEMDMDDMLDMLTDNFEENFHSNLKREQNFFESIKKIHHFATKTPYRFVNPTHHDLFHFKSSEFSQPRHEKYH